MNFSSLSKEDLLLCLEGTGPDSVLFEAASSALKEYSGRGVYLRGIIELSNRCRKNCFYCGLRKDNRSLQRYTIPFDEVISCLETGYSRGLRSFLLQSGELLGISYINRVEEILQWVGKNLEGTRMVLSMGELSPEILQRLKEAGAHRYLLRIESSSRKLYSSLHPADTGHDYDARLSCLRTLRETGWQTGTGVLIGVPGQTAMHLADDLLFMKDMDIDMCGMGPYIEHNDTPLWERRGEIPVRGDRELLTLRMIALTRLLLPTANIAATTALQTLDPEGLEKGLLAGANVVMPNLTPLGYRTKYNLYQGKTLVEDSLDEVIRKLGERCNIIGRQLELGDPGDPVHYTIRMGEQEVSSAG